jgi:uncharacterized protein YdhG (YjbR/CyaY superfamily)
VPDVEEKISYVIPTFKQNGVYLVYIAGFKNNIGCYATLTGNEDFKGELSNYKPDHKLIHNMPISRDQKNCNLRREGVGAKELFRCCRY